MTDTKKYFRDIEIRDQYIAKIKELLNQSDISLYYIEQKDGTYILVGRTDVYMLFDVSNIEFKVHRIEISKINDIEIPISFIRDFYSKLPEIIKIIKEYIEAINER